MGVQPGLAPVHLQFLFDGMTSRSETLVEEGCRADAGVPSKATSRRGVPRRIDALSRSGQEAFASGAHLPSRPATTSLFAPLDLGLPARHGDLRSI